MKDKQTLILTIIAVVTLLSLVGGATYAYFSYTNTISSDTNTITSVTASVGNVSLTATTPSLYITTTAINFKEGTTGTFWSTETAGTYANSESKKTINTLKATGGSSTAIYDCTYTLNVVTTGLPSSGMSTGEYVVYIAGVSNITLDMGTVANRNKTYTVRRFLTGETAKTISASAKLVSKNSAQNYLQGLTIETNFTASNLSCTVAQSAGTDTMIENAQYTVTFDPNGGSVSPTSKTVNYLGTYNELPEPTKSGSSFLGWHGINIVNKASSSLAGIRNETALASWAGVTFNNAWVISNLQPSTTYTISHDVECMSVPEHDSNGSSYVGFRLYSGVSGYSDITLWVTQYLSVGDKIHISKTFTTPANLHETAANYRILVYTNRYLNNGSGVMGSMKFTNLQIEEGGTATAYEPYYIESDTQVVRNANHTITALWQAN